MAQSGEGRNTEKNPFETGPYIQVAAFCDQVIEGKDGTLSLIRLIDTLTSAEASPDPPLEMPPLTSQLRLVMALKSGRARGRHEMKLVPQLPSGETRQPMVRTVHLESEERGTNMIFNIVFTFAMEGLYYFNVYFDDVLLTKLPFSVKYSRIVTGPVKAG